MLPRWAIAVSVVLLAGACGGSGENGAAPHPATSSAGAGTTSTVARSSTSTAPATTRAPRSTTSSTSTTAVPTTVTARRLPPGDDTTVDHVVDGDTIVVQGGERVRLIGIDTPETKDPRRGVQCFGKEASRRTSSLLPSGTEVRLAYDVERFDRYDRALAYVYRSADGLFVNAALVRDGYASAYTYPPNVAHADEFVALQREAREADRGLWGACPGSVGGRSPTGGTGTTGGTSSGSRCDPAYPGVCIPSPPPDLDCGDVDERRFQVLPPDPHHLDTDGDGVGCEGS